MLSQITKRLALVILLMFGAYSVSLAVSQDGWWNINGKWTKGTVASGKTIAMVNGVATIETPWSLSDEKGNVIAGSIDQATKLEFSGKDPHSPRINFNLTISDETGVSIESPEPLSVYVYDIERGSLVVNSEKVKELNLTPNQQILPNRPHIMIIIDSKGNQEIIKFSTAQNIYK